MTIPNIDIPVNFRIKDVGYKLFTSETAPTTVTTWSCCTYEIRVSITEYLLYSRKVDFLQINIFCNTRLSYMFTIVFSEQLRKSIRFKG